MREGLYRVSFETDRGAGFGVVYVKNGQLRGGDSGFYYVGTYEETNGHLTAQIVTQRHGTEGPASVFGLERAHITFTGLVTGEIAKMTATAKEAPGVTLKASLAFLCP